MVEAPTLRDRLAARAPAVRALARELYERPELSGAERFASRRCGEALAAAGFRVEPVDGVETAFVATGPADGPTLAFLAEYDALPDVGHACGHHLIAGAAIGAATALVDAGVPARVLVVGCPSEETLEGKRALLAAGVFDDVDAAFSFHPHERTTVMASTTGLRRLELAFEGRAAHAGERPWEGTSALDGVLLTLHNVNALRQFVRDGVRIHGVVTDGGGASNVVAEHAACTIDVRAHDAAELARVTERVIDCARAGALASGSAVTVEPGSRAEPFRPHPGLRALAQAHLERLGETVTDWDASASTDVGDVSAAVPTVLLSVASWPEGTGFHTRETTRRGGEEAAFAAMERGALALALTAADVAGLEEPW